MVIEADVIYYAYANKEFTDLEGEPKPLFIPENKKSCIDGDIVYIRWNLPPVL